VSFDVAADAYDRFMGRYSRHLSPQLADFAGVAAGARVLDVGCGPGALTAELVRRTGAGRVAAADPSASFVEAVRARHPGVEVHVAGAEDLPFPGDAFDATLAQLVVPFMRDPAAGLAQMRRVTRRGGTVAASAWDHAGGRSPLAPLWAAVREHDPAAANEARVAGAGEGRLPALLEAAGLGEVEEVAHEVQVRHESFEEWWEPFSLGVGPAGAYVARLDPAGREALRERCRARLGDGPLELTVFAWAARGTA